MSDDGIEIRVGVIAARTFRIMGGYFQPVAMSTSHHDWATPTCVAHCRRNYPACECDQCARMKEPHESPHLGCQCGVYSFRTAQETAAQYFQWADDCLAVVEPAGEALEGSIGWRSKSATIIAAWVKAEHERLILARNYPTVVFYQHLTDLFAAYPAVDNGGIEAYRRSLNFSRNANNRGLRMSPRNNNTLGGTLP